MTRQQLDIVKKDRMKYKGNAASSNLALLAVAFNAFYFIVLYKINETSLYTLLMGVSVVYNLFFMLTAFLGSIRIKAYSFNYAIALLVLAVGQIVRIFIIPTRAYTELLGLRVEIEGEYFWMILWLCLSAASFFVSGIFGIVSTQKRKKFLADVQSGEIDISFISSIADEV